MTNFLTKKRDIPFPGVYLKKGYTIHDMAKLSGKGVSTVQRVKKEFVD